MTTDTNATTQTQTTDKPKRAQSTPWLMVMGARGGPVQVNRATSQQGALLATAIAAGAKGASIDDLVDAARPFTSKVIDDYAGYLLSYFTPSWVQAGNGYGLQVKSTDRALQRALRAMQAGPTAGRHGMVDRGLSMSKAYKLAKGMGKVDSLRLRLTVPNATKGHKGLPRDKDIGA